MQNFSNLHGELGELAADNIIGRENNNEITFFKLVGVARFDMAVAAAVYEKAIEAGVGMNVEL